MKNIMRYFNMAVLVLAATMMTGCSKDEPLYNGDGTKYTTTLSMASNGSKALTDGGVKTFAVDDQIAVIYKNNSGNIVKAVSVALTSSDIAEGGKQAQFTVTLDDPDKNYDVTYIYPAYMAKDNGTPNYDSLYTRQDGTLSTLASKFDYCSKSGSWSGGNLPSNLRLENQLAICKFTINDFTSSVTKLTIKNGSDIYSVTPSSLSAIYVAMKPVTTGDFKVYAAQGKALYKKDVSNKTLNANTLYTIPVTTALVPSAVSGLFLVNGNLIYFSKGNLQASTTNLGSNWTWNFATNQYDLIGSAAANTSINGNGTVSANGTVDLFGWVGASNTTWSDAAQYGISNETETGETNNYGNKAGANGETLKSDWGNTVGGGWRTPTNDEWSSIFSNHTYGMANVNNVKGIIILPYNSSKTINTNHNSYGNNSINNVDWAALEAAGAVFLPAAGYRSVATVYWTTGSYPEGFYWSATPEPDNNSNALYMTMTYQSLHCGYNQYRCNGYSVRLIGE